MRKILLIGSEEEENLALRYLGAVLVDAGHYIKIAPCSKERDIPRILKLIKKFKPDLVAISIAFQSLANIYFKLAEEIKKVSLVHITCGGHFPTFEYKKILETKSFDSVVRFEGETAIVQLVNALADNKSLSDVSNLVYNSGNDILENKCICQFMELDKLPFPVRNIDPHVRLGEKFATLISSRGCFHSSCLYCCIGAFHSKKDQKFAMRSPENIAIEIAELNKEYGVRLFQFHDDNFMLPDKTETIKRFDELKRCIEQKGVNLNKIAFLIKARPDSINVEVADKLKELGCIGIFLGVENASETGLKALIRGSPIAAVHNAFDVLKNYDMAVTFNLLIFHPNATLDEINQNILFIKNHKNYALDFGRAEIVAGSPLERQVIKDNLLRGTWPNWDYKIKDPNVEQLFFINKQTFRKGKNYSKLMHLLIALGYQAYAVNRIYPGKFAKELLVEANSLIVKSNEFILQEFLKMYKIAATDFSEKDVSSLADEIDAGCLDLMKDIIKLNNKIKRLQILEKNCENFNVTSQDSNIVKKVFRI